MSRASSTFLPAGVLAAAMTPLPSRCRSPQRVLLPSPTEVKNTRRATPTASRNDGPRLRRVWFVSHNSPTARTVTSPGRGTGCEVGLPGTGEEKAAQPDPVGSGGAERVDLRAAARSALVVRDDTKRLGVPRARPLNWLEADARTRTGDPIITSDVLYQLSY